MSARRLWLASFCVGPPAHRVTTYERPPSTAWCLVLGQLRDTRTTPGLQDPKVLMLGYVRMRGKADKRRRKRNWELGTGSEWRTRASPEGGAGQQGCGQPGAGLLLLPGVGYNMAFGTVQEEASSTSEGKFSYKWLYLETGLNIHSKDSSLVHRAPAFLISHAHLLRNTCCEVSGGTIQCLPSTTHSWVWAVWTGLYVVQWRGGATLWAWRMNPSFLCKGTKYS